MTYDVAAMELSLGTRRRSPRGKQLRRLFRKYPLAMIGAAFIFLVTLVALAAPLVATQDPNIVDGRNALQTPSADHWFGTDRLGRDVFSRITYGSRISLQVGVLAVLFAGALGVPLGLIAGYFGGIWDGIVMRWSDSIIAFPNIVLALALVLVLGPSVLTLMFALGLGASPAYARLVRGQVLAVRELDFVMSARSAGASDLRIIGQHVFPNVAAPIIVASSLTMAGAVLAEASLSFLGVGIRPPTATWGGMLQESYDLIYVAPWLSVFPGAAIFLLTLSLNLIGDGLRDALDPRIRRAAS